MAGQSHNNEGMIVGINVTPLVDVVLVLLVVFIVTAKIISTPAIPMELPQAASGQELQVVFSVVIDAQGTLFVDGSAISNDSVFLTKAREAKTLNEDVRAVIHADGGTAHRRVVKAMDLLKRAGIQRVAFATVGE
jgi:biopolymer transport protein ExbD